jgi:hypothetical protein
MAAGGACINSTVATTCIPFYINDRPDPGPQHVHQ